MHCKTTNVLHATVSAIFATAFSKPPRALTATVTPFTTTVAQTAISGSTSTTLSNYIRGPQVMLFVISANGIWIVKVQWTIISRHYTYAIKPILTWCVMSLRCSLDWCHHHG